MNVITVSQPVYVLILAVVQGLTEFLPVSSSGHLVALGTLIGAKEPPTSLLVILHFGTLFSILVYYRLSVVRLLREDRKVVFLLIVGTLPAVAVGLLIKKAFPWIMENMLLAGFMLMVTGLILTLFSTVGRRPQDGQADLEKKTRSYQQLTVRQALLIGLVQSVALLPGISRSCVTILAGLLVGLDRRSAATFSFLLAIPAITAGTAYEARQLLAGQTAVIPVGMLLMGAAVAFLVGLAALHWVIRWLDQGRFHYFAFWVLPAGALVVVWSLYQRVQ